MSSGLAVAKRFGFNLLRDEIDEISDYHQGSPKFLISLIRVLPGVYDSPPSNLMGFAPLEAESQVVRAPMIACASVMV